jgi:hypothetical protein
MLVIGHNAGPSRRIYLVITPFGLPIEGLMHILHFADTILHSTIGRTPWIDIPHRQSPPSLRMESLARWR